MSGNRGRDAADTSNQDEEDQVDESETADPDEEEALDDVEADSKPAARGAPDPGQDQGQEPPKKKRRRRRAISTLQESKWQERYKLVR